jgi:hypothetical protein
MNNPIIENLYGKKGFFDELSISLQDLEIIRELILSQFREVLSSSHPELNNEIIALQLQDYHEFEKKHESINHGALWPKINRIFSYDSKEIFRSLDFFKYLEAQLGPIQITNEEEIHDEEVYWRLARPSGNDVGPMHADRWFWDLGHGKAMNNFERIKIWIAIFNETGESGLRYVPASHTKEWPYSGQERDGFIKPMIDISDDELDIEKFFSKPGDVFIFNDRLLHGGFTGGSRSRVSIECTLLIPQDAINYPQ